MKPILSVDFDGVLNSYKSGWVGVDHIPDTPVPGAMAFLYNAQEYFTVAVFSSRSSQDEGREAMQLWVHKYMQEYLNTLFSASVAERLLSKFMSELLWPVTKPPAFVSLDDRCVCFTGRFPDPQVLREFQPWTKRKQ